MKRILQIAPSITVKGGISTVLKMYFETDLASQYDLKVVATHKDGTKLAKVGIMLAGIMKLIKILITNSIDIVHIHCGDIPSPYRKYIFFKISRWFKCSVILHLHGALFIEQYQVASGFWKLRLQRFFEGADKVICLSQTWSDAIGGLFPRSNRVVVPNGILLPEKSKINAKTPNETTQILFLGLIGPRKGVFDLLTVIKRLVEEGYDIRLSIGGNGDVAKLKDRLSLPQLKRRVHYLGWIEEDQKDYLLAGSDIFTLPSYGEGMPVSIIEAMAYGLAVISTPVGGIPELVDDGVTGYLVKPGDIEDLYEKLKILIEQADLRVEMGRNGRLKVEDGYNIVKNYKAISCIYEQLK
jgi:glycosyltransferase involved in cell wall biosynthesis